jgi:hypothetical protein
MMNTRAADDLGFDAPAVYRIRVRGRIPANWSNRLEGMTIVLENPPARPACTTLEGELSDQASLYGVLNALYSLHLPVQSVECLGQADHQP